MTTLDMDVRFWQKVDRGESNGCWIWLGGKFASGYGAAHRGDRRVMRAHRVAYELLVGAIPDGLVLDHLCRTKACVNPAHLEPVTQAENLRRGLKSYSLRNTCKHGHDITDSANVITRRNGSHECRTCVNQRQRMRRLRGVAA